MSEKIKIMIVEDDKYWVKAISAYLKAIDEFEIIGTAFSRSEAVQLIKTVDPHVCLMDIDLNGNHCDGIFAAMEILELKQVKIIMLTALKDEDVVLDSFTAGAVDYVNKDFYKEIPTVIKRSIRVPTYMNTLLNEFGRLKKHEKLKDFSHSERELYQYLEKGFTQSQIEKMLYKTKSTIKSQVKSIIRKLNVSSSKEAIEKINKKEFFNADKQK